MHIYIYIYTYVYAYTTLCSPILISRLMMDSNVECDTALPSLAVVWKRMEGSCGWS